MARCGRSACSTNCVRPSRNACVTATEQSSPSRHARARSRMIITHDQSLSRSSVMPQAEPDRTANAHPASLDGRWTNSRLTRRAHCRAARGGSHALCTSTSRRSARRRSSSLEALGSQRKRETRAATPGILTRVMCWKGNALRRRRRGSRCKAPWAPWATASPPARARLPASNTASVSTVAASAGAATSRVNVCPPPLPRHRQLFRRGPMRDREHPKRHTIAGGDAEHHLAPELCLEQAIEPRRVE
jgi:hypothetical protein